MEFDLLSAVQPDEGWFAIVGIGANNTTQRLVETREEADRAVGNLLNKGYNVFYGVAKYVDGESRTKANVKALKAFWLDIDCGPNKDYPNQQEALLALRTFCEHVGMPKPVIVNSGRGLHVYWPLTEEISREEWEPVATRLREVCSIQGMRVDASCFEVARILRVPGTFNFKGETPLPVEVLSTGEVASVEHIRSLLGVKPLAALPSLFGGTRRELSPLAQSLRENLDTSFDKIMSRKDSCAQLKAALRDRETLSEPRWFAALSIAKQCLDRELAVSALSEEYPGYDEAETERKLEHIKGPHSCEEFEKHNPGGCAGCPHWGKIKSPVQLGKTVAEADAEDLLVVENNTHGVETLYHIPEFPFPYKRGKNGGIWWEPAEGEPVLVYEHDLYIAKRMQDIEGGVVLIRHHTPNDGVVEFTVPTAMVSDGAELRKILAAHNIVTLKKQFDMLVAYIVMSFSKLFNKTKAELMRNQFGWADGDGKFIIGDREISVEGVYHSPPSTTTQDLAEYMAPCGSFEKWKEVFDLYGLPGMEPAAFAAATAFGAPLLKFSGQRGAIINVVNTNSGTGKTTSLYMCNSVWGHPEKLCAKKDDTFNSKVFKLGVYRNLPTTFDEMSNMEPKQLSELAYLITQGSGKDRMKASSNELRRNQTTWQTIALCSSNHSFYEKLEFAKDSPQGELMRIIEYPLDYSSAIDMEAGKHMFDHQLHENYGWAGDIYARYLVENYDEAKKTYLIMQGKIDTVLKLTQRERFWSATVAANIAGIHIAIRLGLCNWDIAAIFKWACKMILSLRRTTTPPLDDKNQILAQYIMSNIDCILVVNDKADQRTKLREAPLLEPRRELLIRIEPDTKLIFVARAPFRKYCAERSIGYNETLDKMRRNGLYIKQDQKRMTKGMKFNLNPVPVLIFNGAHPEFDSLTAYVEQHIPTPPEEIEEAKTHASVGS